MAFSQPDSLGILDSMEICSEETEGSDSDDANAKDVQLHELSSAQVNCLDPFR